jgi:hypothetical protein
LAALISNFEPDVLEPDRCKVELRMESSTAYLYGTLIRSFMHVKEVGSCGTLVYFFLLQPFFQLFFLAHCLVDRDALITS